MTEITESLLKELREAGVEELKTLYLNDLDRWPFIFYEHLARRRRPSLDRPPAWPSTA